MTACAASSKPSWDRCCDGCSRWSKQDTRREILILIALCLAVLALAFGGGCTRTILVSEASPIRVGPSCVTRVYTKTDDGWRLSDNPVTVPEGWYCVPPSYVEEER